MMKSVWRTGGLNRITKGQMDACLRQRVCEMKRILGFA